MNKFCIVSGTKEKILIQIVSGKIIFEFSNVDLTMKIQSKVDLCPNCWFRVLATRYGHNQLVCY